MTQCLHSAVKRRGAGETCRRTVGRGGQHYPLLLQDATCRVTCWHADMSAAELAQTGRMVQERNVLAPGDTAAFDAPDETPEDPRFVHPDDARAQEQFELEGVESGRPSGGAAAVQKVANVLVATDAALRAAPEVRAPTRAARIDLHGHKPSAVTACAQGRVQSPQG